MYSQGNEKCHYCKYGDFFIIYYSNLKSDSRFGQLIEFYVQNCPWMLNLVTYDGSYEGLKIKIKGISSFLSPSTEIENRYSVFSIFLVLLGNGFIFGQFLKSVPVLKSSEPQLSHGHIYFSFALSFLHAMKHFCIFFYFLDLGQRFSIVHYSLNILSITTSKDSFERRIEPAVRKCH